MLLVLLLLLLFCNYVHDIGGRLREKCVNYDVIEAIKSNLNDHCNYLLVVTVMLIVS